MTFPEHTALALGLTLAAGLSTGIGSALAFVARETNRTLLSVSLGFSAGVMMYVSFVEMLPQAKTELIGALGAVSGAWWATGMFFVGFLIAAGIDQLVPSHENPHEFRNVGDVRDTQQAHDFRHLHRLGLLSALVIAIHNFPEGIATFMATLNNPSFGIPLAVAIAIHNIPEGIAVAIPIFYATGSRLKAFTWSFASGLAEPIGALLGAVVLLAFFSPALAGGMFAATAGIMVFIALDELLPTARAYGQPHHALLGLVGGMAVMAASLLLML